MSTDSLTENPSRSAREETRAPGAAGLRNGPDTRDEIFVGGVWTRGSGALIESVNPATAEVFATLHAATAADVDAAVAAGLEAVNASGWATRLPHERAAVLHRISAAIEANADRIAELQTLDTGKTLVETKALAMSAAATFRTWIRTAAKFASERPQQKLRGIPVAAPRVSELAHLLEAAE